MFSKNYPNLNWWIENQGHIELGSDSYMCYSLLRVLDEGGMCWEDNDSKSLDEAIMKAEIWAASEIKDRLGEEPPKIYKT